MCPGDWAVGLPVSAIRSQPHLRQRLVVVVVQPSFSSRAIAGQIWLGGVVLLFQIHPRMNSIDRDSAAELESLETCLRVAASQKPAGRELVELVSDRICFPCLCQSHCRSHSHCHCHDRHDDGSQDQEVAVILVWA